MVLCNGAVEALVTVLRGNVLLTKDEDKCSLSMYEESETDARAS